MMVSLKYAIVERERRFLVSKLPGAAHERRRIMDRYVTGTRLRLREVVTEDGAVTRKRSGPAPGLPGNYPGASLARHLQHTPICMRSERCLCAADAVREGASTQAEAVVRWTDGRCRAGPGRDV